MRTLIAMAVSKIRTLTLTGEASQSVKAAIAATV